MAISAQDGHHGFKRGLVVPEVSVSCDRLAWPITRAVPVSSDRLTTVDPYYPLSYEGKLHRWAPVSLDRLAC